MTHLRPQKIHVPVVNMIQRNWVLQRKCNWMHHHSQGKRRFPTVSSINSFLTLRCADEPDGGSLPLQNRLSVQWVDLQILSTITWLSDQISPQSSILWAPVRSQKPPFSFSFLQPPPPQPLYFFERFRLDIPTRTAPSHPCSPAPLHACTETDFIIHPCQSPREPNKARAWESALPECKRRSQSASRRLWPTHTLWPMATSPGPRPPVETKLKWNEEGCSERPKPGKLNRHKLYWTNCALHRTDRLWV